MTSDTPIYYTNPFYPTFIQHPFIQQIALNKRWTISDNIKRPIDMIEYKTKGKIVGATYCNEKSLVSLPELYQLIPNAANFAYYLDATKDNFVVLDIEPTCPAHVKKDLLQMQPLYIETSMSGNGIHMVFEYPKDIIEKYEHAKEKVVLKGDNHDYEILIKHYVTFTGRQLQIFPSNNPKSFRELFETLASRQKPSATKADIDFDEMKPVDTKELPFLMELLHTAMQRYPKKPDDFKKANGRDNDTSLWEYAVIGYMYRKLKEILQVQKIARDHEYTLEEQIWIMHEIIYDYIDYRPKHDTLRGGRPFLIYLMESVIAKYEQ